jgi:hypothetical protein
MSRVRLRDDRHRSAHQRPQPFQPLQAELPSSCRSSSGVRVPYVAGDGCRSGRRRGEPAENTTAALYARLCRIVLPQTLPRRCSPAESICLVRARKPRISRPFAKWAGQDLNLRPTDYEPDACAPAARRVDRGRAARSGLVATGRWRRVQIWVQKLPVVGMNSQTLLGVGRTARNLVLASRSSRSVCQGELAAKQKVEGSNPFSRFEKAVFAGLFRGCSRRVRAVIVA